MAANLKATLDELLRSFTSRGDEGIPGVALIVTRSSGDVYRGSAGIADLGKLEEAFTVDTVIWIASMTKAITSVAALQCVERGLVGLDDDLSKIMPELRNVRIIDRTKPYEDGNYTFKPAKKTITLRHLLTHSNGLIYPRAYPHADAYCTKHGLAQVRGTDRNSFFRFPSWHEAGEEWHYGQGIDYAGAMVEYLTGQSLGDYMAANIFKPLDMNSSAFSLTPEMKSRKATMYDRTAAGKVVAIPDYWPHTVEKAFGGGGLWSTTSDYEKFVRMLLNKGQSPSGHSVLKPETLEMATKGHLEPAAKVSCNEVHMDTQMSKWPGVKRDYSLIGLVFEEELASGRAKGSVQWDGMASCHWSVDFTKDIGIVQCVQITPYGDTEQQKLLRAVEEAVYKSLAT